MASSTLSLLRLLMQDASGTGELLSDAEYNQIIAIESNLYRAASISARTIASKYADKVSTSLDGDIKFENQQKFEHWNTLALEYDKTADKGGSVSSGNSNHPLQPYLSGDSIKDMRTVQEDTDRPPNYFRMGMLDNVSIDNQETDDVV